MSESESDSESTESVSKVQEVGKGGGQHAQNNRPPDRTTEYRGREDRPK
jgi:hypothetical protein